MMRLGPLLLLLSLASAGCEQVSPITVPTPTEVAQEAAALAQARQANDPVTYQKAGFGLVERECHTFFDVLDKAQDQASFEQKELTLAGGAAAGILAALRAGTVPITVTGIAVPLIANSIGSYRDIMLFTPYPDETAVLVKNALQTFRDNATTPTDMSDAVALVQGYAAICTYSGIHQLAKQALATAKTADQSTTTSGALQAPPPPPPRGYAAPPPPPRGYAPPPPPPPGSLQLRVHIPNVVVQ